MWLQMSLRFLKTVNLTVITVVVLASGPCCFSDVGKKYTCLNKSLLCVFRSTERQYKNRLFTFSETNFAFFYPNRLQRSYLKEPAVDVNSLKAKWRTAPIRSRSGCRVISELEPTFQVRRAINILFICVLPADFATPVFCAQIIFRGSFFPFSSS